MSFKINDIFEETKREAEEEINNKVITGQWDGEPIWREKTLSERWEDRITQDRVIREETDEVSEKVKGRYYNPYNTPQGNDPFYTARD